MDYWMLEDLLCKYRFVCAQCHVQKRDIKYWWIIEWHLSQLWIHGLLYDTSKWHWQLSIKVALFHILTSISFIFGSCVDRITMDSLIHGSHLQMTLRWRLQKREGTMLQYYLTFPHSHLPHHTFWHRNISGWGTSSQSFGKVSNTYLWNLQKKWASHPPHIIFDFRKCSSPHLVGCLSTWGVVQRARMPVYKDMLLGYKMKQRQRTIISRGMKWWLGCHSGGCVTWSSAPMMLF